MTQQIKPTIMVSNEEEAIVFKNVEWMFQFDNGEPILFITPLEDSKKLIIEINNTSTSNICFYDGNGNTFKIFAREKQIVNTINLEPNGTLRETII
jgi:hypothetical protein